ncbi:MAG: response regulator [Candidatus Xenobia bacterium]
MTILVVEDNATILKLVCQVLKWKSFEVLPASRGDEALALLASNPTKLDLILTDVDLPGMSGCDLVAQLRKTQPQARILYMSGQPLAGASYLEKPFTPDKLLARIQDTLEGV